MSDEDTKKALKKISKHRFYFETPLYEVINREALEDKILDGDVDAYSAENSIDTTYAISTGSMNSQYETIFKNFYKVTLICKRKDNDVLRFFIYVDDEIIFKVGQKPSLADIQFAEIGKKYDKYLSRQELKEFKRAIGLVAHGVGAGSFVYLRRIFESLITKTYQKQQKEISFTEIEFKPKHMTDKIEILKKFLPKQLVEMKSAYSVLSKGVHELSEEDCLKYFPVLKLSIELILEEQIELEKEEEREKEVKAALQDITQNIGKESD